MQEGFQGLKKFLQKAMTKENGSVIITYNGGKKEVQEAFFCAQNSGAKWAWTDLREAARSKLL